MHDLGLGPQVVELRRRQLLEQPLLLGPAGGEGRGTTFSVPPWTRWWCSSMAANTAAVFSSVGTKRGRVVPKRSFTRSTTMPRSVVTWSKVATTKPSR